MILSDADGHQLTGKVTKVELFAVPDAGIPFDELQSKTAVYHIEYPLAKPPASLGFRQHFNTGTFAMPVVVQLTVVREGLASGTTIPVPECEEAARLTFDWSQSAGPATAIAAEKPAAAKPAALDATAAFVYIQNDEVRIEILMPLPTLIERFIDGAV